MADSPIEGKVTASSAMTWRSMSALHRKMGARIIRFSPLVMAANAPLVLFDDIYGERSIDRIIGCRIHLGASGVGGTFTLADQRGNFLWGINAQTHFGNYGLNIETGPDGARIVIQSSVAITAAMLGYLALFNFEIPDSAQGHLG